MPELLEIIFSTGYQEVDCVGEHGHTPLYELITRIRSFPSRDPCAEWLLKKGANGSFKVRRGWPNILFYWLPDVITRLTMGYLVDDDISLYLRDADPMCVDGCQCLCSRSGCLAWHGAWNMAAYYNSKMSLIELADQLSVLTKLMNLNRTQKDICYTEVYRLEVFNCLGLIHTCCGHVQDYHDPKEANERQKCQEEDSELIIQLNLIMTAFERSRKACGGKIEKFWVSWWERLGQILPPLSSKEREWKWRRSSVYPEEESTIAASRADRERATLVANGYGDYEDFADVIRDHFKEYLVPQVTTTEGSDDEWIDTDFSDDEGALSTSDS